MNDLETLHEAWGEPLPPSHVAYTEARAALLERAGTGDGVKEAPAAKRGFRMPRMGVRLVAVGALAVTIAAGVTVVQTVGGVDEDGTPRPVVPGLPAGPVASAQEVLNRAASAAEARSYTPPRADQWVYVETWTRAAKQVRVQTPQTPLETKLQRSWTRGDGLRVALFEKGKLTISPTGGEGGMPPSDYRSLLALPRDPDKLIAWFHQRLGGLGETEEGRNQTTFSMLSGILHNSFVPPQQEAAIYRALAKIPGVQLDRDAKDVQGRPALGVTRIIEGWARDQILLDRSSYAYLGARTIAIKDNTSKGDDGTWRIKKGTIVHLAVRRLAGVVDKPGQFPKK